MMMLPPIFWQKAEGKTLLGEMVCAAKGSSHLLDRSLLKERNKRISSRYVNVNLQREKERKKTNTEATGRLAQIWPIQRGTETDKDSSKWICVLDWRQTGGCGLKWVAEVVLNMSMHAKISWYASECILCAGPRSHHFRVSAPQMSNTTGRQIRQKRARRMQDCGWNQASWNSPDRTGRLSETVCG